MSKLTDSQLIVLSAAAARDDGAATIPAKMNKAAASKVGASLVTRKLIREVRAKPDMPVWRVDGDRRISLVITAAGRRAIDVDEPEMTRPRRKGADAESLVSKGLASSSDAKNSTPRSGSKQAMLIEMLKAKGGARLDALMEATGWLPHTTRAALTGLRKRGYAIERAREGEASVYRLAGQVAGATAA